MNMVDKPHSSILIVDDDPLVSELVAKQCTMAGLPVQRAPNGLRALGAARQHRPTLLITALRLPHLDEVLVVQTIARSGSAGHGRHRDEWLLRFRRL
jgi:CheY-like chemotaxis protein